MTRRTIAFASACLAAPWLGACSDGSSSAGPDGAADVDAVADAGPETTGDDSGPTDADAEAVADAALDGVGGTVPLTFDLTTNGHATWTVSAANFTHSAGTVHIGHDIRALAYQMTDWTEYGYKLYHVLAPEADTLHVLYLYCGHASAMSFDFIWHEAYGVPMDYTAASGICSSVDSPIVANVALDALADLPAPESIHSGLVVNGPDIVLDDAGGWVMVAGKQYAAQPFGLVDCTTTCSADPIDGWWEIHSVLRDPDTDARCFGVVYLMSDRPTDVAMDYGFCLDSLTRMPDVVLTATWSSTGAKSSDLSAVPLGPRDPRTGIILRPRPPSFPPRAER